MISLQVFPRIGAVRTRGPDGKIRTAGARVISQSDSRFQIPDRRDDSEKKKMIFNIFSVIFRKVYSTFKDDALLEYAGYLTIIRRRRSKYWRIFTKPKAR